MPDLRAKPVTRQKNAACQRFWWHAASLKNRPASRLRLAFFGVGCRLAGGYVFCFFIGVPQHDGACPSEGALIVFPHFSQ